MNRMKYTIKQEPDALDLTNRPQHLLSPSIENEDDDDEYLPSEDEQHTNHNNQQRNNFHIKKSTYDSGFIDTSDENNDLTMVKQERNRHHYHSTPLRSQQINSHHIRHPSTSSSTCSSSTHQERSHSPVDDKECRNTRFLGSRAVAVLNHWFQSNRDYPYPDDERTDRLAREAGITQKQVKKWFANKRVRSQMCYKPLYRSRKSRNLSSIRQNQNQVSSIVSTPSSATATTTTTTQTRRPQTNYNYIINHNNIATPTSLPDFNNVFSGPNPPLFNPMAASMMMFMMQQHLMTTMMAAAGLPQLPSTPTAPSTPTSTTNTSTTPKKTNVDRITRFWL
ncbi:unnamed protein product [Rotaria sordida]|uniref:Homeobox domain-containing protein n=1 Tax=Rotaria sordida TaxID=392033 RepID=A0A814NBF9_9BILA|nr:unnamed protein product [Rotaria sordida]CAF3609293.1 unnamed protein product [Rotaria sordida]